MRVTPLALNCLAILVGCAPSAEATMKQRGAAAYAPPVRGSKPGESADRLTSVSRITVGSSEKEVTGALQGLFSPVHTNRYMGKYPFTVILPYTNIAVASEWRLNAPKLDDSLEIIFGIFSSAAKTNLIDALSFRDGHVEPLVDGAYNRKLFSLEKGDSIEEVYKHLGRRECEYFFGNDGRWCVRFLYFGLGGRVVVVEADAASGRVLCVREGTI